MRRSLWLLLLLGLAGCREPARPTNPATQSSLPNRQEAEVATAIRFDATTDFGTTPVVYSTDEAAGHYSIVESLGGGVAVFDYDGDRRLDLWFPGGGRFSGPTSMEGLPHRLLRGGSPPGVFHDVADAARLSLGKPFNHGVAVADADNDGFADVLVTGYTGLQFFQNQGDGTFVERSVEAELTDNLWSASAGWGDLNKDGQLDLYLPHYVDWSFENDPVCVDPATGKRDVCPPRRFGPLPDVLYLSDGMGAYRAASAEVGLRSDGKGLGVVLADVDADGQLDIYVTNDTVENFLYLNAGDGKLTDVSVVSGSAYDDLGGPDGSMGVALFDFDADGLPDLFVTNFEDQVTALYRNLGNAVFRHQSQRQGLAAVGEMYVGWGIVPADFDLDGDEDLAIVNGHIERTSESAAQVPVLFENRNSSFVNVASQVGPYFREPNHGRGLASGDFDADGRVDLVAANAGEPAALIWNRTQTEGRSLRLRLIGTKSPRWPIGAVARLIAGDKTQSRRVIGGGSYASSSEPTLHFGYPSGVNELTLEVDWPSGRRDRAVIPASVTAIDWIEGRDEPWPVDPER